MAAMSDSVILGVGKTSDKSWNVDINAGFSPGVPMLSEGVLCSVTILQLAEGPFIDDIGVARVVEQTWRDPWLCGRC
jgi:hypothetical protein